MIYVNFNKKNIILIIYLWDFFYYHEKKVEVLTVKT